MITGKRLQPHTGFFGKLDRQDRQVVDEAIEAVGISHKAYSYMAQLSDGEKQKAMIAKVLAQECPLVILDEPTAFLDDPRHRTSAGARRLPMAFTEGARNA